jgi:serine/threonine-protein kinase HipA
MPPSRKYERNQAGLPGPSAVDALQLIGHVVNTRPPAAARIVFLGALVFNVMIQNTDAHAKNYSLLIRAGDKVDLAPLYDLASRTATWQTHRQPIPCCRRSRAAYEPHVSPTVSSR